MLEANDEHCCSSKNIETDVVDDPGDEPQELQANNAYVDVSGHTRLFYAQSYRCCFSAFHAKIGTFVLVTLVFHEIILGMFYLLSRDEMMYRNLDTHYITVFISRLIQLVFSGVMYFALWRQRWEYVLPFAISQLTFGTYADISTIIMLIRDLNISNSCPSWNSIRCLHLIIPIFVYLFILGWLMYALYRCSIYFRDRHNHLQGKQGLLINDDNAQYDLESSDFDPS
uniref:XK-related protein n=1 Tax=Syphacia muris TaxID=451379 RepID=A0A0N5A802_9BILA